MDFIKILKVSLSFSASVFPLFQTHLHLLLQFVEELAVGGLSRDGGGALGGQDGSSHVLQALLQRDLGAAWTKKNGFTAQPTTLNLSKVFSLVLHKSTVCPPSCPLPTGIHHCRLFAWVLRSSQPVHVCQPGQNVGCFAKVAVLLVVAPQQVHVVHFALVLLDHVHEVIFQIGRVHLEFGVKGKKKA